MRIKVAIVNREARFRDLTGVILVSKELIDICLRQTSRTLFSLNEGS